MVKLKCFDGGTVLAIQWANTATGDCRVRALKAETKGSKWSSYTNAMTLEQVREYIEHNREMLGTQINDCVGLVMEDEVTTGNYLDFIPIPVKSPQELTLPTHRPDREGDGSKPTSGVQLDSRGQRV